MLYICGEVRKVIDQNYNDKSGKKVTQAVIIIEPELGKQNYEVVLNATQINGGAKEQWQNLKGQLASIAVNLFVNHEYKFHKFNAIGSANPIKPIKG